MITFTGLYSCGIARRHSMLVSRDDPLNGIFVEILEAARFGHFPTMDDFGFLLTAEIIQMKKSVSNLNTAIRSGQNAHEYFMKRLQATGRCKRHLLLLQTV